MGQRKAFHSPDMKISSCESWSCPNILLVTSKAIHQSVCVAYEAQEKWISQAFYSQLCFKQLKIKSYFVNIPENSS